MYRRLGVLELHGHVRHQVLHGLEGADRLPELLAIARVRDRDIDHALGQSQALGGSAERAAVQRRIDQRTTRSARGDAALRRRRPVDPKQAPRRIQTLVGDRRHIRTPHRMHLFAVLQQQQVRHVRIGNQRVTFEADRKLRLAGSNARQPLGGNPGIGTACEQRRTDQHRIDQRLRQRHVAHFLGEQHEVELVHAEPAVLFGRP
jgi:hypothetical protein